MFKITCLWWLFKCLLRLCVLFGVFVVVFVWLGLVVWGFECDYCFWGVVGADILLGVHVCRFSLILLFSEFVYCVCAV